MNILCAVPTRNRRSTTLSSVLTAIAMQRRPPDELVIIDSSDNLTADLGPVYRCVTNLLESKGITVRWDLHPNFGPHDAHQHSQQLARSKGFDLIWRVDDDSVPEPDCLEHLLYHLRDERVGVAGPLVLSAPPLPRPVNVRMNRLSDVGHGNSIQRCLWQGDPVEVEHLVLSFLYRANVADYNLRLSRLGVTEETQFTHEIWRAGYKIMLEPKAIIWHLMQPVGGIRDCTAEEAQRMKANDNQIFQEKLKEWEATPPAARR